MDLIPLSADAWAVTSSSPPTDPTTYLDAVATLAERLFSERHGVVAHVLEQIWLCEDLVPIVLLCSPSVPEMAMLDEVAAQTAFVHDLHTAILALRRSA